MKKERTFKIRHKYKRHIFVPYVAIEDNLDFFKVYARDKICHIITSDGIECDATNVKECCIIDAANTIIQIYSVSAWDYIKLWKKAFPYMDSLTFVEMDLNKKDNIA